MKKISALLLGFLLIINCINGFAANYDSSEYLSGFDDTIDAYSGTSDATILSKIDGEVTVPHSNYIGTSGNKYQIGVPTAAVSAMLTNKVLGSEGDALKFTYTAATADGNEFILNEGLNIDNTTITPENPLVIEYRYKPEYTNITTLKHRIDLVPLFSTPTGTKNTMAFTQHTLQTAENGKWRTVTHIITGISGATVSSVRYFDGVKDGNLPATTTASNATTTKFVGIKLRPKSGSTATTYGTNGKVDITFDSVRVYQPNLSGTNLNLKSSSIADNATEVPLTTEKQVLEFYAPVLASTIAANITVKKDGNSISPAISQVVGSPEKVQINFDGGLSSGSQYLVTIGSGLKDVHGRAINATTRAFTAETATAPLSVLSTSIENGATNVKANTNSFDIIFNNSIDVSNISDITVSDGQNQVSKTVTLDDKKLTIKFDKHVSPGKTYIVTVGTGIKDTSAQSLSAPVSISFTTESFSALDLSWGDSIYVDGKVEGDELAPSNIIKDNSGINYTLTNSAANSTKIIDDVMVNTNTSTSDGFGNDLKPQSPITFSTTSLPIGGAMVYEAKYKIDYPWDSDNQRTLSAVQIYFEFNQSDYFDNQSATAKDKLEVYIPAATLPSGEWGTAKIIIPEQALNNSNTSYKPFVYFENGLSYEITTDIKKAAKMTLSRIVFHNKTRTGQTVGDEAHRTTYSIDYLKQYTIGEGELFNIVGSTVENGAVNIKTHTKKISFTSDKILRKTSLLTVNGTNSINVYVKKNDETEFTLIDNTDFSTYYFKSTGDKTFDLSFNNNLLQDAQYKIDFKNLEGINGSKDLSTEIIFTTLAEKISITNLVFSVNGSPISNMGNGGSVKADFTITNNFDENIKGDVFIALYKNNILNNIVVKPYNMTVLNETVSNFATFDSVPLDTIDDKYTVNIFVWDENIKSMTNKNVIFDSTGVK